MTIPQNGGWPLLRAWPLISDARNADPSLRPSAASVATSLKGLSFTLPIHIVQRIIDFLAFEFSPLDSMVNEAIWKQRTRLLSRLCLLSHAHWAGATRALYHDVRLYLNERPSRLSQLIFSLDNSTKNPLSSENFASSDGHGQHTRLLLLAIQPIRNNFPYPEALSTLIRNLLSKLPRLRYVLIRSTPSYAPRPVVDVGSLTTLEIQRLSLSLLVTEIPMAQALSRLERLCIRECSERLQGRMEPALASNITLPNLQDITLYGGNQRRHINALSDVLFTLSKWTIPRLTSLQLISAIPLPDTTSLLQPFLQRHGPHLRNLVLDAGYISLEVISSCKFLRSLSVSFGALNPSYFIMVPSHANLENITFRGISVDAVVPTNADHLRCFADFKTRAYTLLPKLVEATLTMETTTMQTSIFFRQSDNFITLTENSSSSTIPLPLGLAFRTSSPRNMIRNRSDQI